MLRDMKNSPIPERIVRTVVDRVRAVPDVVRRSAARSVPISLVRGERAGRFQMSERYRGAQLSENGDWNGQHRTEDQPLRRQLSNRDNRGRDHQYAQIAPHNFSVNRSSTPRCNERRKNRINQGEKASEGNAEYIVHGKRPRTQLMLTLRLIGRSGKRIRHNTMACGINSLIPRIRRFSAVSRVRLAALTIPALLLCACASAHGDDACSTPYAGAGQQLHGGRPA
ncbi:hypothetical protein DRA46_00123 [Burkholderia gladioli]|nr:hypothetical protein [Burkholderia gladioli]